MRHSGTYREPSPKQSPAPAPCGCCPPLRPRRPSLPVPRARAAHSSRSLQSAPRDSARCARRMNARAARSASAVTLHVFTTTTSAAEGLPSRSPATRSRSLNRFAIRASGPATEMLDVKRARHDFSLEETRRIRLNSLSKDTNESEVLERKLVVLLVSRDFLHAV